MAINLPGGRVIFRGPPRFPKRPQYPPDYMLPEDWQDWEGGPFPHSEFVIWSGAHELRKLQVVWARVAPTGVATDPAVTTHHFLNLTNDAPDATWVDADFTTVENAFVTFWNAVKTRYPTGVILDQFRWYKDGPAFHPTPAEGNPAVRVVEQNLPGTEAMGPLPPQCAVSITEKTALRKRWGRIYMPNPTINQTSTGGLIAPALVTAMANAIDAFYETCTAADIVPVVFSPTLETTYQIESTQVDDLFDVMRSRRWKQPTIREVRSLTQ